MYYRNAKIRTDYGVFESNVDCKKTVVPNKDTSYVTQWEIKFTSSRPICFYMFLTHSIYSVQEKPHTPCHEIILIKNEREIKPNQKSR